LSRRSCTSSSVEVDVAEVQHTALSFRVDFIGQLRQARLEAVRPLVEGERHCLSGLTTPFVSFSTLTRLNLRVGEGARIRLACALE